MFEQVVLSSYANYSAYENEEVVQLRGIIILIFYLDLMKVLEIGMIFSLSLNVSTIKQY